jgi:hypothetical protein
MILLSLEVTMPKTQDYSIILDTPFRDAYASFNGRNSLL